MGDVAESLGAVLAERTVVFTTVSKVAVAVSPASFASELALTSPMIARLTIASFNSGKMEAALVSRSHEPLAVVHGTVRVVHSSLATVSPVAVEVTAERLFADAKIALSVRSNSDALAPVEGVNTIEGVAFLALATRTASSVAEDVSLATSHGVIVAILPALSNVANEVAFTGIGSRSIVDASDP